MPSRLPKATLPATTKRRPVLEGPHEPDQLPAQLIRPASGSLLWLLDSAAAGRLERQE